MTVEGQQNQNMTSGHNPDMIGIDPVPQAALSAVQALLQSGELFRYCGPSGSQVAKLEEEFAQLMGVRFALAVCSCSGALFLSLKALNLQPKAKVLVPAFTFAAVPSAVVHAGCEPLLVECGPDYRMDLDDFHAKLPQADAVLISHMRGHTSDMDVILAATTAANIPVVEDAAHSLGTYWQGRRVGTLGAIGCFSFQSYKMINAGEGGILLTDDPELAARATVMSGAYEDNWRKHPGMSAELMRWQNKLPLYNMRMQNLSAAVIRPQLPLLGDRAARGRANHDLVAAALSASNWVELVLPLPGELRAPDSIQFNLVGDWSDTEALAFSAAAKRRGLIVQNFGLSEGNARAYWNWQFLAEIPELPKTRAMLTRAVDMRLPARLSSRDCEKIARLIMAALAEVKG